MLKRLFDLIFSGLGLIFLAPFLMLIALAIMLESRGGIFYLQTRVGKGNKDFSIYKFRTMYSGSDKKGLLTVGARDSRITRIGFFLRKYKLDEFPQLINVLKGDMSLVGPRPEVRKYVALYNPEQMRVLEVKPGITDYASIEYANENELLAKANDPERYYIEEIFPAKIQLNMKYIRDKSPMKDVKIILQTLKKIIS